MIANYGELRKKSWYIPTMNLSSLESYLNSQKPLLDFLLFLKKYTKANASVYLVGGLIRDCLRGDFSFKDIDVMVDLSSESELLQSLGLLKSNGVIRFWQKVGRSFPVFKVHLPDWEDPLDIALARREVSTGYGHRDFHFEALGISAKDDGQRRDFTVNALFAKIVSDDECHLKLQLVDYFNGLEDLKNLRLRAVGNTVHRFEEDPLRMLRAIRFQYQKGFSPDSEIVNSILRDGPKLLPHLSYDRIQDEVLKAVMANPQGAIRSLLELNVFQSCLKPLVMYLPDTAPPWLPKSPLNSKEQALVCILLPWLNQIDFLPKNQELRILEQTLIELHFPNPRKVRACLQGICDLVDIPQSPYPQAWQEKILSQAHSEDIVFFHQLLVDGLNIEPLIPLVYPDGPKVDGQVLKSWGIAPGPGYETILLTARQMQFKGMPLQLIQDQLQEQFL